MNISTLVFSADGTSVAILFANGSESLDFESKEEALFAVHDCYKKSKITKDELEDFIKKIILATNLPNHNPRVSLIPLLFLVAALVEGMDDEKPESEETISDPYTQTCDCGNSRPHGYVYNKNGKKITPPFQFKTEGYAFVDHLLKTDRINEGDAAHLNVLIGLLPLPESPDLN